MKAIGVTLNLMLVVVFYHGQTAHGMPQQTQITEDSSHRINKRQIEAVMVPRLNFQGEVPAERQTLPLYGSTVLECQAAGTPPPTIHWLKNGKRIHRAESDNALADEMSEAEENGQVIGLSSTVSRLYLDCVSREDKGLYTCVAENRYKRIATDTKIKVQGRDDTTSGSCKLARKRTFMTAPTVMVPARIVMYTSNMLEMEGGDVTMFCRATGSPTPDTMWLNGAGQQIVDSDKHQVLDTGDLVIRGITFIEDMGVYECVAKNSGGESTAESFLYPTAEE